MGAALKALVVGSGVFFGSIALGFTFTGGANLADINAKVEQTVNKYNQLKDKYIKEITEGNNLINDLTKEAHRANLEIKKANEEVGNTAKTVNDKTKDTIADDLNKLPEVSK